MNRALVFFLAAFLTLAVAHDRASASTPTKAPDLAGSWRFDPSQSDAPPSPGSMEGRHGGMGGSGGRGGHGGGGGPGGYRGAEGGTPPGEGGERGGGGRRPARLPDLMLIAQNDAYVSLEDSTRAEVVRIVLDESPTDPKASGITALALEGRWKGDRLEAEHQDDRGFKIEETITLKEKGRLLEVKTKIAGRRSFEVKRVYIRQTEPVKAEGSPGNPESR